MGNAHHIGRPTNSARPSAMEATRRAKLFMRGLQGRPRPTLRKPWSAYSHFEDVFLSCEFGTIRFVDYVERDFNDICHTFENNLRHTNNAFEVTEPFASLAIGFAHGEQAGIEATAIQRVVTRSPGHYCLEDIAALEGLVDSWCARSRAFAPRAERCLSVQCDLARFRLER
jgi:hypothetical protein